MVRGILYLRRGRKQEAAQTLAAAFVGLRSNPWTPSGTFQHAISAAVLLAQSDHTFAPCLLTGLKEPFAACYGEQTRRSAATAIAACIDATTAVRWVESYEPFPIWKRRSWNCGPPVYRKTVPLVEGETVINVVIGKPAESGLANWI